MHIDKDSKVILLPETASPTEFKLIQLPISNNLNQTKSYLYEPISTTIYELNQIRSIESAKLKSGDAVKSFIIESGNSDGAIIQSPRTIISSKFNLCYLLISSLYGQKNDTRFITIDDFMDRLTWSQNLPESVLISALEKVCEELNNDDVTFYKFSIEKSLLFINEKILALVDFIANQPNSIIDKIKAELTDPTNTTTEEIPQDILNQLILQYAIDYVCSTYIEDSNFKQDLINKFEYKFDQVEKYLVEIREKQKSLALVEANMNEVINSTIKNRNKEKEQVKKSTKKIQVKKVAVGKGALDGFFKRA
ncbi:hypothetical protein JA1_004757 [Spathaspora sp. JA1]|nr:hypothetical protein JA1_004757 [Spathaspora sp. JA1]